MPAPQNSGRQSGRCQVGCGRRTGLWGVRSQSETSSRGPDHTVLGHSPDSVLRTYRDEDCAVYDLNTVRVRPLHHVHVEKVTIELDQVPDELQRRLKSRFQALEVVTVTLKVPTPATRERLISVCSVCDSKRYTRPTMSRSGWLRRRKN